MGLTTASWLVIAFGGTVLYGGLMYFIAIAMGWRLEDKVPFLDKILGIWRSSIWGRLALIFLLSLLLVTAGVIGDPDELSKGVGGKGGKGGSGEKIQQYNESTSGTLNEQESISAPYDSGGYNVKAVFVLTWTDEPDNGVPTYENEGDTFTMEVIGPEDNRDSGTATNEHGQEGRIELFFDIGEKDSMKGEWNVTITLDDAGDHSAFGAGTGVVFIDDSNAYTLEVSIEYLL